MQKKILKGIKPFNECWFRSCYYHQIIAGMSRFGVPPEYTLLNYIMDVTGDSWQNIECKDRSVLTDEEYAQLAGVDIVKRVGSDIVADIIKSVNSNRPIMIGQDNYCLPYRAEYQKLHGEHFILVYGYDSATRTFTVLEHSFVSGLDFCERVVPMEIVATAHRGFVAECKKYAWDEAEFIKKRNGVTFARRVKLIEKLCRPLHERSIKSYLLPYELLPECETVLERIHILCIYITRYFRALLLQYEIYCKDSEICDSLERIWLCAHFMQGVTGKAEFVKSTDLFRNKTVVKKIDEMRAAAERFDKAVKRL